MDCPWNLADAILAGLAFTDWDELTTEDRPPKKIWFSGGKLKEHWEQMKRRKEQEMGINGRRQIDSDGPVLENDAVKDLIVDG